MVARCRPGSASMPATQTFSGTPLERRCRGAEHPGHRDRHRRGQLPPQDFTVTVANTNDGPVAAVAIADQASQRGRGLQLRRSGQAALPTWMWATALTPLGNAWPTAARLPCLAQLRCRPRRRSPAPRLNDDVGALSIRVTATDTCTAPAQRPGLHRHRRQHQ